MYDVRQTIDELNAIAEKLAELMEHFPEHLPGLVTASELLIDAGESIDTAIDLVTKELKVVDGMQGG